MNKTIFFFWGLIGFLEVSAHSHHTTYIVEEHHHHHKEVVFVEPVRPAAFIYVDLAPPADCDEEMGSAPGADFVYVKGYWAWDGSRYVRVHGHWIARPHAAAVWVPGYWSEHHGKWRWHEGYWQF